MNKDQQISLITKAGENAVKAIDELKALLKANDLSEATRDMGEGILEASEDFYREINHKYVNNQASLEDAVEGLLLLVCQTSFANGMIVNDSRNAKLIWMGIIINSDLA